MAWCAGGLSIWRNGSSRNSASQSPSRRSAGSCAPWATANCRPDRVTMRKPRARSRILKKLPRAPGGNCAQEGAGPRHDRNLVRRRGPHRPEEQDHPPLGQARHPSKRTAGPTHRFHLHLRCSLPEGGQGCSPDHAGLQHRGDELAPRRDRRNRRARCPRHPPGRSSRLALVHPPPRAGQYHHHSAAAEVPRAQPGRERLAVHARQLALQPHLQILLRSRRPLLCGMEQARRSALAASCPSDCANGPTGSDQWDLVLGISLRRVVFSNGMGLLRRGGPHNGTSTYNFEQVTCREPTVTPINSAISSRLFPRSTRFLICSSLSGVNFICLPRVGSCVASSSVCIIFVSPSGKAPSSYASGGSERSETG